MRRHALQPAQLVVRVRDKRHRHAAQRVLHLRQALRVVVGVLGDLRECGLPAGRVRVAHHGGLAREGIDGMGHVVTAQQVALHSLRHAAARVVIVSRIKVLRGARAVRCEQDATRQLALAAHRGRRIDAPREAFRAQEAVAVVQVTDMHRLAPQGALHRTLPFLRQAAEGIVQVVAPAPRSALNAVLREHKAVHRVILVKRLPAPRPAAAGQTTQTVVGVAVAGRRERRGGEVAAHRGSQHVAEQPAGVVHVVRVGVAVTGEHPTVQERAPLLVEERQVDMTVLVRRADHFERTRRIHAPVGQDARGRHRVYSKIQFRFTSFYT